MVHDSTSSISLNRQILNEKREELELSTYFKAVILAK